MPCSRRRPFYQSKKRAGLREKWSRRLHAPTIVTGLTSKTTGFVSEYRPPLPSTNLKFLSTFMWDGREPNLTSQAKDATRGHAQKWALLMLPRFGGAEYANDHDDWSRHR
jgi:hypothetical protein